MPSKSDLINDKPWTRQEDMILLQNIKKEYSENSFLLISEKLENRTVDQVISYLFLIYVYIFLHIIYMHIYIKIFFIVGEREMPNFAFFTSENDVNVYMYIMKSVILYIIKG